MAKLCPKGKAAAKRKFKVYPSAYANMYASGVCSGKIKPGGRKKAASGGPMQMAGMTRKRRAGCAQLLFRRRIKKMGTGEMGRHWSAEKERKVSTLRKIEGKQEEISKVCPACKSIENDCWSKGFCG